MRREHRDNVTKFGRGKGRIATLATLAALVAGCAQEVPIQVVTDSLCTTAKKRTWSVNDTPETIEEAVRYNRAIDKACGIPGQGATKVASAP